MKICSDPSCPACEIKAIIQRHKDNDIPPGAIMELFMAVLEETIGEDIGMMFAEITEDADTVH